MGVNHSSNNPLVDSVKHNNIPVASWTIGIGAPLPANLALTGMLEMLLLDNK
jgi:hypothetical protein